MPGKNRKPYQKPQLKKIDLTPKEAVLAGCKSAITPTGKIVGGNTCGNKDNFCQSEMIS